MISYAEILQARSMTEAQGDGGLCWMRQVSITRAIEAINVIALPFRKNRRPFVAP
jgi:hypothetical protein